MLSNYPAGAEHDPNAPYNQHDPEPREIDVEYSCSLKKQTTIAVDDYEYWEDHDEDGGCCGYDYSGCDLWKAWKNDHYNPVELLARIASLLQGMINDNPNGFYKNYNLVYLKNECEGWTIPVNEYGGKEEEIEQL